MIRCSFLRKLFVLGFYGAACAISIDGCGGGKSSPPVATATPSATPTARPTATPSPSPTPVPPTPTPSALAQHHLYAADSRGMRVLNFGLSALGPASQGTVLTYVTAATAAPTTSINGLAVDPAGKALFYQAHFAGTGFLEPSNMFVEGCTLKFTSGNPAATCAQQPALDASLSATQGSDAIFGDGLAWGGAGLFVASTLAQATSPPSYNTGSVQVYSITQNAGLSTSSPVLVSTLAEANNVNGPASVLAPVFSAVADDPYGNAATSIVAPSPGATPGAVAVCAPGEQYVCSTLLPNLNYPIGVGFDGFGDLYALVVSPGGGSSLIFCIGQSGVINPSKCVTTTLSGQQATALTVDRAGNAYLAISAPIAGILVVAPNGTQTLDAVGLKGDFTALAIGP